MRSESELKVKFVEMCKFVEVSSDKITCIFEDIEEYSDLANDPDYPILKEKMTKILDLVNSDKSLLNKDLENEIWYMV